MTVCLVIPPSPFLLDERVFMSLGVLRVAAALEHAKAGRVEVLDLSGVSNFLDAVAAHAATRPAGSAPIYGITATSPQLPAAVKIAGAIRATAPASRIILGGPHPTLANAAAKREAKRGRAGRGTRAMDALRQIFDVIVAGDGEYAVFKALHAPIGSVIDADDRHSPLWLNDAELESIPFPARHLVDVASYHYKIDGAPALSLIAQLGCPFGCKFCAGRNSPMLRHIRTRSSQSIVAEMVEMHQRYGCTGFMFYDDELNVNPGIVDLMEEIVVAQKKLGTEWRLRGFVKSELFTAEQADVMRRAGFRWLLVGFESGSDRILDNIAKKATKEDNTRCFEIARDAGLKIKALMSLGHPGESAETIRATTEWLLDVRADDFDATIITPYPGSPYYDDAVSQGDYWTYTARNGDRLHQDEVDYTAEADYYKGRPGDGYVAHVWTDHLKAHDLVRERDRLERVVRERLNIPFNPSAPAIAYEHSMGQSALPPSILRASA
jgi:anaerobic magnesium-protoporphyrin IX monomethyl ester cyclase